MEAIKKFIKNILTGVDNETHDVAKVLAVVSVLVAIGLTIYEVAFKDKAFDIIAYGTGIAALFAGLGAALYMKKDTEPKL